MSHCRRHAIHVSLLLYAVAPGGLIAQIRASERGSVSQTVDGTVITVEYARPRARGRDPLFGGVVRWEEVWTPGANWATTLEASKDIQLDGHPLPKGKYSVWMKVGRDQWTAILDPRDHRYHTDPPDSTAEQVRFAVHPGEAPFTEALTWSFPDIRVDGGTLALQWGSTRVAMDLKVEPSHKVEITRQAAAPYLGSYRFQWKEDGDSTKPSNITLVYQNDRLIANWDSPPFPELATFVLIRIADNWFIFGQLQDGEVYDVTPDWVFEFSVASGKASGFEIRGEADKLMAVGTRKR